MNRTTFWRRVKRLGCNPATVNKIALSGVFNLQQSYKMWCKFLEMDRKLKNAGINSTAELDQFLSLLVTLAEMEISNVADLKAYRQRIWDLKGIKAL